jgi:hypothetical protein
MASLVAGWYAGHADRLVVDVLFPGLDRLQRRLLPPHCTAWQSALDILDDIGHANAGDVRARLSGLHSQFLD